MGLVKDPPTDTEEDAPTPEGADADAETPDANLPVKSVNTDLQVAGTGMPDDGFSDLDDQIGFGSFPIVKLDKTEFLINDETLGDGNAFTCRLLNGRKKILVKESGDQDTKNLLYSYDGIHDTAGKLIEDRIAEWKADGVESVERKTYFEAAAQLIGGDRDQELVLLSIPPASVSRLSGYRASVTMREGVPLSDVITKCSKGAKVKIGNNITFYPWQFSVEPAGE